MTLPVPDYDQQALMRWVASNQKQQIESRRDASLKTQHELYPWDITYPLESGRWRGGFDQEFPDLAQYFHLAYGLERRDLDTVVLLPVRSDFIGQGFWHSDPDETGLRMYLENTEHDRDFLLIKACREARHSGDPQLIVPNDGQGPDFSDRIYSAGTLGPRQAFFLNNIRGIHAVNVSTRGAFRIAVIVTIGRKFRHMPGHLIDMIQRSAQEYPDLAVMRQA